MKLWYAPQSPFARKVRAAAIELGVEHRITLEYAEVRPGKKNPSYASSVNPLRKVPTLVLDDGTALMDSTVICEYLDKLVGGGHLVPADGPDRWRILFQHAVAQGMCDAIVLVRYEQSLRPQALRWSDWVDDQWDKIWAGLAWFEDTAAHRLTITRPDLSQLALACCLGYIDFRYPDTDWRKHFPKAASWYEKIALRPSLQRTRPIEPPRSV